MKAKRENPIRKRFLILLALTGFITSQAYAAQSDPSGSERAPRTLERLDVGYELPIEIVAVRILQKREHWVRDLEIEVKNVSQKPIYEVYFTLFLPNDKYSGGAPFSVCLQYGRFALIHPMVHASSSDKPISPGETVTLRVHERLSRGYEYHLRVDNPPESASYTVRLLVVAINFGDGTGFVNCGVPYPRDRSMESRPQKYLRIPVDSQ